MDTELNAAFLLGFEDQVEKTAGVGEFFLRRRLAHHFGPGFTGAIKGSGAVGELSKTMKSIPWRGTRGPVQLPEAMAKELGVGHLTSEQAQALAPFMKRRLFAKGPSNLVKSMYDSGQAAKESGPGMLSRIGKFYKEKPGTAAAATAGTAGAAGLGGFALMKRRKQQRAMA